MVSKDILKKLDDGIKTYAPFTKAEDSIIIEAIKRGYGYKRLYKLNILKNKSLYQIENRISKLRVGMDTKRKQF